MSIAGITADASNQKKKKKKRFVLHFYYIKEYYANI